MDSKESSTIHDLYSYSKRMWRFPVSKLFIRLACSTHPRYTLWFLHHQCPRHTFVLSFFPVGFISAFTDWALEKTKWWTNQDAKVKEGRIFNGGWKFMSSGDTKPYKHLQKIWTKVMAWYLCEDWRIFAVSELVYRVKKLHVLFAELTWHIIIAVETEDKTDHRSYTYNLRSC